MDAGVINKEEIVALITESLGDLTLTSHDDELIEQLAESIAENPENLEEG